MKKLLPIANVLALVGVLVVNYLANALPIAGRTPGEVSDMFPTLFTPAGFTFSIWGIIYLLLISFAVFQAINASKQPQSASLVTIGWLFVVSCLANAGWLFAFHHLHIGASLLIMMLLLGSLMAIYLRLAAVQSQASTSTFWFVHLPFSVYLGWISVATIANASIFLSNSGWTGHPPGPVFWTVVVIATAVILGILALLRRNDFGYTLVIIWALFGIYSKRMTDTDATSQSIITATIIGMAVLGVLVAYRLLKKVKR